MSLNGGAGRPHVGRQNSFTSKVSKILTSAANLHHSPKLSSKKVKSSRHDKLDGEYRLLSRYWFSSK